MSSHTSNPSRRRTPVALGPLLAALLFVAPQEAQAGDPGEAHVAVVNLDRTPNSKRFEKFLRGVRKSGKSADELKVEVVPAKDVGIEVDEHCNVTSRWQDISKKYSPILVYCSATKSPVVQKSADKLYLADGPPVRAFVIWSGREVMSIQVNTFGRMYVGRQALQNAGRTLRDYGVDLHYRFP